MEKSSSIKIVTQEVHKSTQGDGDYINLTFDLEDILTRSGLAQGQMTIFNIGSTAAIASFEFEPGLVHDIRQFFESVAPSKKDYQHDSTWNDKNGFSHVRATAQGPSLVVPFQDGKLLLGSWQQIVLCEFDIRPRTRRIVVQLIGL